MPKRRRTPSARARILGWYVLFLAAALAAGLLLQRSFLLAEQDTDVDANLDQEVDELGALVEGGVDPDSGSPFGDDLRRIFEVYLDRNVALVGEGTFTIVDGEPYVTDETAEAFLGTELERTWVAVQEPTRDEVVTDDGTRIRYLAIPMLLEGEQRGVFVVTTNMSRLERQVDEVIRIGALVYGSIFLVASIVAWVTAGSVLRPLRVLDLAAKSISETDLSRRIAVQGDDEISALARTFNGMLDRLESAFGTQRRFVDDAGHELRTPITIIRGQLELMGDDPVERRQTVALVTGELDRMSRIVEDLLSLAKAEQPDFIQPKPVDLAELIHTLAHKGVALTGRPVRVDQASAAVVEADEQRLTQALTNLIRNAAEHTPDSAEISIGGTVIGGQVRIWVSDTGPGIAPQDQDRLFERFARGSVRRSSTGAGLGLSIVKAIVEGHGGQIDLDSSRDGTRFTLVLPGVSHDHEEEVAAWRAS